MKISTKTLAQFFFNVLGFTKEEIRKLLVDALEQEVRRQTHRAMQRIDVDKLARENVQNILRCWDCERKVITKIADLVQSKLDVTIKEK